MINVALIGLGYWGGNYLRVLQNVKGVKLSYICDSNPEALKCVPSNVKTTLDYEEIIKDEDIKVAFLAAVLEQKSLGSRAWSRVHRFGFRWVVEGVFSVMKRVFGEYVLARKFVNMVKEVVMKAYLYNIFVALASS